MVRSRTSPGPGVGVAYSSIRKSVGFGSPTGRETRTTRFADWDMAGSSGIFVFRHCERSEAMTIAILARKGKMDCFVANAPRNDEHEP